MLDNATGIVAVTGRTIQGRYLTRPSAKANQLILGVIGRAQELYEVDIFAFVYLSNHYHYMLRVDWAVQLSEFMRHVNTNIAKELGRLHDWSQAFWGHRFHSASIGDSEASQMSWLAYIFKNSCKEGLVGSPLDWPGVTSANALHRGDETLEGVWYDRLKQETARKSGQGYVEFPEKKTVHLSALPFIEGGKEQQLNYVRQLVSAVEEETAARFRENGTTPLGVEDILAEDPHGKPEHFERSPAKLFHAATLEDYWPMYYARVAKELAYRAASKRLKKSNIASRNFGFPEDCHPPPFPRANRGKKKTPT